MCNLRLLFAFLIISFSSVFALEKIDEEAIEEIAQQFENSWNYHGGKGFGDHYAENAKFINIVGMKFFGREAIEERHIKILDTFLKDSTFEVTNLELREKKPGVVVATMHWTVEGFRDPGSDMKASGETRKGIFTHILMKEEDKWEIIYSVNTLLPE